MSERYDEESFEYSDPPQSTKDEFFGDCWSVRHSDGEYTLDYISGELAGRLKQVVITEDDYRAARAGEIDLSGLCIKYHVN
ncbi:hypothetical protein OAG71_02935 [bacterium]|nr:hypothetical protein [bacterium]